jgi:hydroxyethylthiazole kinase-like uncharacterized protein yjeF
MAAPRHQGSNTTDGVTMTAEQVAQNLPARTRSCHKGDFGHVLIVGGDRGFGGAAIMAAQAAALCGAGLVSLFTRSQHVSAMLCRQPEVMVHDENLNELMQRSTVIVIGPGLGLQSWGLTLLEQVLACEKPMLLDADALNYLAGLDQTKQQKLKRDNWILTPHPGEAARLLSYDTATIEQHRSNSARQLQKRFGGTIVLKGRNSLICGPEQQLTQLDCGNPGMASGGMGDVLSGIIGALVAQGLSGFAAASTGAWLHSTAADRQAELQGERGLLATAILPQLALLLNKVD